MNGSRISTKNVKFACNFTIFKFLNDPVKQRPLKVTQTILILQITNSTIFACIHFVLADNVLREQVHRMRLSTNGC